MPHASPYPYLLNILVLIHIVVDSELIYTRLITISTPKTQVISSKCLDYKKKLSQFKKQSVSQSSSVSFPMITFEKPSTSGVA